MKNPLKKGILHEYSRACIWCKLKKTIVIAIYNSFYFLALHAEFLVKEILNNKLWDKRTNKLQHFFFLIHHS